MSASSLPSLPLRDEDQELIAEAIKLVIDRGTKGRHHISCALRTEDRRIFYGLHLHASLGPSSACAEAAAVAASQTDEPRPVSTIVSIRRRFGSMPETEIVPPCGRCRELVLDYGPESTVIVRGPSGPTRVRITDLLPTPFRRTSVKEGSVETGTDSVLPQA